MKKEISKYIDNQYIIIIPVYYENETAPAWRKVYKGTLSDCRKEFFSFPDSLKATPEENKENRKNKLKELLFLESIGRKQKADQIRKQYNFI